MAAVARGIGRLVQLSSLSHTLPHHLVSRFISPPGQNSCRTRADKTWTELEQAVMTRMLITASKQHRKLT